MGVREPTRELATGANLAKWYLMCDWKSLNSCIYISFQPLWRGCLSQSVSSVTQSCLTLCNLMYCSTPGFSVHHQLPEFTQTSVHRVKGAIQPSHPLLSPSLPTSIFPSIRVFSSQSVLRIRWPKYWSFGITLCSECSGLICFRSDLLDSWQSTGLSRVFSNSPVQKHRFFGVQPSSWGNSHIHTWLLEKP